MFYYVLPGVGIYGGIKKGFHCAELLTRSGFSCVVATPRGERPTWFETSAEVMASEELPGRCGADDALLFSFPPDARFVDRLPARRKVVHMQGANTKADVALFRHRYEFISHGLHMTDTLLRHGKIAPYVPIGVPDKFRWKGTPKRPGLVAVMSRKGGHLLKVIESALPPCRPRYWTWALLLRRAFDLDDLRCPRCAGRKQLIATIDEPRRDSEDSRPPWPPGRAGGSTAAVAPDRGRSRAVDPSWRDRLGRTGGRSRRRRLPCCSLKGRPLCDSGSRFDL